MSLNIKDPAVHELAREAARRTGLNQTRAVERGLRILLAQLDQEQARTGVDALLDRMYEELVNAGNTLDMDELYDPTTGLPR